MKRKEGNDRWRTFIIAYDKKIEDFNYWTNPKLEYGQVCGRLRIPRCVAG
jgi:hypothetical protein